MQQAPSGDASAPENVVEPLEMRGSWLTAFVPVLCFLLCCIGLFVYYQAFDLLGLAAGGVISLLVGALFARNYSAYWDAVMRGIGSPVSVTIVVILFVIGIFAELVNVTNLSSGFVWIAAELGLGASLIVLFTFIATSLVALATGSSIGTMFTAFPIFYPAGVALGADPPLLAGAILSGSILGDNIAPISDTTIISASTQRFRNRTGTADIGGVVRSRARYCLTAAGISAVLFLLLSALGNGSGGAAASVLDGEASAKTLVMLIPVALLVVTAFLTRDIFKAVTVGLVTGTITGLLAGLLSTSDIVSVEDGALVGFVAEGVGGIIGTVALVITVFGIMGVLNGAGVLDRVVSTLQNSRMAGTPRGAEASIGLGTAVTTMMFGGVNSASMMTFGPVTDEIGARVGLHPYRRCNVMDCFAMGLPATVPFLSAYLFIGTVLTSGYDSAPSQSVLDLFPTTIYPIALVVVIIIAILTGWGRRFEGANGVQQNAPAADTEEVVHQ